MKNKKLINYITKVAIFSALSTVLYVWVKFPLPFLFPSFLDIQFSNLPAILAGLALGPLGGALVVIIRTLGKLAISGSGTMYVGELADLLIGLATVLTTSFIYKFNRTKKGGIIALIAGTIVWIVSAVLMNWLFIIPAYLKLMFDGSVMPLIGMCQSVLPNMNQDNYMAIYIFGASLPFNALLATTVGVITFFVYKRISIIFKKDFIGKHAIPVKIFEKVNIIEEPKEGENDENNNC